MGYDLKPLKAPRTAGNVLRVLTAAAESSLTGGALADKFLADIGVVTLRQTVIDEPPTFLPPVHATSPRKGKAKQPAVEPAGPNHESFPFETAYDFVRAYKSGRCTPLQVAERVLAWTSESDRKDPAMRIFIAQSRDDLLAQAEASAARYRDGNPLGPLDGVPIAVKDELDQAGYRTTVGTSFLGRSKASEDAEPVARLRRAGALLIGKANMHEIGMGVTGLNPHHGPARNPYLPSRATGGSSSGSAAAVAAGFCPIAVGADGGGSIRIPSSLCGVVGLKPTFSRVSEHGAAPLCWSLAHVGPIAVSARDAALAFSVMAGPDPKDPQTLAQPPVDFHDWENGDLSGLRIGVYWPWFNDAEADVVRLGKQLLETLTEAGAELREISVSGLSLLRTAHLVTIASEMVTSNMHDMARDSAAYGNDVRVNLSLASRLRSSDYVQAQRVRTQICRQFATLFEQVDLIATPTTGCTAPELMPDALETGDSNLTLADRIMRFSLAANLTGVPGISLPAGYDYQGLPVGLQLMAAPFEEVSLLRVALVAEARVARRLPRVHSSLLE
ncbi:MAG: amidase [Myxococcales bacterium]|nr:amidase [Myxococcales bacterium]